MQEIKKVMVAMPTKNGNLVKGFVSEQHAHVAFEGEYKINSMRVTKHKSHSYACSTTYFSNDGLFAGISMVPYRKGGRIRCSFPGRLRNMSVTRIAHTAEEAREVYIEMVKYYHSVSPLPLGVYLDALDIADSFIEYYYDNDGVFSPYNDEFVSFGGMPKRVTLAVRFISGVLSYSINLWTRTDRVKPQSRHTQVASKGDVRGFYRDYIEYFHKCGFIDDKEFEIYSSYEVEQASVAFMLDRQENIRTPEKRQAYLLELARKNSPELITEHGGVYECA